MPFLKLFDQVQEFVAGTLVAKENTAEGRCGCYCIGLLHTSECHACVRRFNDYSNSQRVQGVLDAVADLSGETLLYLKATCVCLNNSGDFAKTSDCAVRDICDMGLAYEWHYVVLTGRI